MEEYLNHLQQVRDSAGDMPVMDRTRIGRHSQRIAPQVTYELSEGFPLQTTKFVSFDAIAKELIWFLTGDVRISTLLDHNIHIWSPDAFKAYYASPAYQGETVREFEDRIMSEDAFRERWDSCGPIYGHQFRHNPGRDQIKEALTSLKKDRVSKKIVVTPWNPADLKDMALEPCHALFQLRAHPGEWGDELILHMYQRSADMFLGVPYNIASYSLLNHLISAYADLVPGAFVHPFGDAHLYADHLPMADRVLAREPFPKPRLVLDDTVPEFVEAILQHEYRDDPSSALALVPEMMRVEDYQHHKGIWAPLHVGLPHELMPDWERRKKYYEGLEEKIGG